jgi:hypothetical protein
MKDKIISYQKDIKMVNETILSTEKKESEDLFNQNEDKKHAKGIMQDLDKQREKNKMRTMESAMWQLLNYELYHKAFTYKQKELDEEQKRKQEKQAALTQSKIEEKIYSITALRELIKEKDEELSKKKVEHGTEENQGPASSNNLAHIPEISEDIAYTIA